jgi:hypothetical protein
MEYQKKRKTLGAFCVLMRAILLVSLDWRLSMATAVAPTLSKGVVVGLKALGFDEAYLEKFIDDDPSILGIGNDLSVVETQRRQEKGRLDLLLQDGARERRFEVELMLGSVDESHLIRTIEYWDIERRTYPAYEHCAVLVAENITARFLNVITLFSGSVPMIAIQVNAIKVEDKTALTFITVVDSRKRIRTDDIGITVTKASNRAEWLTYAGSAIMELVDKCTGFINDKAKRPRTLNYNKQFIGLTDSGGPNNFVSFSPNKSSLWINIKLVPADAWAKRLEEAGVEYRNDWAVRVKVSPANFATYESLIREMLQEAVAEDEK